MSSNVVNRAPYLRTSREFPEEIKQLALQTNKSYIDIAAAVNARTIGIFPVNVPAIGGESWYLNGGRQQNFRQVYQFTGPIVSGFTIPHNINFIDVFTFTHPFGTFLSTDTNYYGIIFADNTVIPNQVSFFITPNVGTTPGNIVILFNGTAPVIDRGIIVLEWISNI